MFVCTLGDLVLDVVVRLRQPLARGGDAASHITLGGGGQAANVAAWVAALGGRARFVGKRADDAATALAEQQLAGYGVELVGPVVPGGRGGVVVSLVDETGERTMCPDRGVAVELEAAEIDPGWFRGCDWLHVSGYALFVDPTRQAALHAAALARAAGARVSVDLASWSAMREAGVDRFRADIESLLPDVVFASDEEDRAVGGPVPGPRWIVKRGAAGCSFDGDERSAPIVTEVVDSTGAGDALAAGWLLGGPDLGLEAAARCVQRMGSMPLVAG